MFGFVFCTMVEFVYVFDLMFKLQTASLQPYHAHSYVLTWIAVVQEIYAVLMAFLGDMVLCFVKAVILQSQHITY